MANPLRVEFLVDGQTSVKTVSPTLFLEMTPMGPALTDSVAFLQWNEETGWPARTGHLLVIWIGGHKDNPPPGIGIDLWARDLGIPTP